MLTAADLEVTTASGSTFADFLPRGGSPLVDTGVDLLERNGSMPRRLNGDHFAAVTATGLLGSESRPCLSMKLNATMSPTCAGPGPGTQPLPPVRYV